MKSQSARISVYAFLIAGVLFLPACKGSSSETPQPTTAVVKLSTAGTLPAGRQIGAIDVTLTLAPGVTLKNTANPPRPDDGVVTASGVAVNSSFVEANYTAPTSTLPGNVRIALINVSGFDTGEFVTVNGDIAAGNNPQAADFGATINTIADIDTIPLTGLTAGIAVDIR